MYGIDGKLTSSDQSIADILQDQFCLNFSNPLNPDVVDPSFVPPQIKVPEPRLTPTPQLMLKALSELKSDSSPGPDGVPAILLKECAEELSAPLTLLWAESFNTGICPQFYKQGNVTPLFKKGDRARASNYRPVTLTSHVVKCYERVMRDHMVEFLESNDMFTNEQHGFRGGRSCLSQLLAHYDQMYQCLFDNAEADTIYLDFSKAFDRVDLRLLMKKMRRYGFSEGVCKWIESFLTDRTQTVVVSGTKSGVRVIISGVPQGTVLGPLLFLIFVNDLPDCVKHSIVSLFADDTRLGKRISTVADCHLLQEDLTAVTRWAESNNMLLNEKKYELISHRIRVDSFLQQLPFFAEISTYTTNSGHTLEATPWVRDLGVIVDAGMTWSEHIGRTVSRARQMCGWTLSVFKSRDRTVMLTLYKSLIRSILDYCSPLWAPVAIGQIQLVESVQRTFTSRISNMRELNYWDRLKELHLMSIQRRHERYFMIYMFKLRTSLVPNDIGIVIEDTGRCGFKARVPAPPVAKSAKIQALYDRSFSTRGPKLWNCLPKLVRDQTEMDKFKSELGTFLAQIPDEPPTPGYVRANNNSVLDWTMGGQWRFDRRVWAM
jgi:hypothetical protein